MAVYIEQTEQESLVVTFSSTLKKTSTSGFQGTYLDVFVITLMRRPMGFMWEFPAIREDLNAEARATGEELYMMALFDRALQAGLQTIILNQIATGQTTKGTTVTGKSTLARNAAMLGGIAALQKLDDIEENTEEVSEGFGFD